MIVQYRGLSSEINVTPLIDVLLVLLIIFMVISQLCQGVKQQPFPSPSGHQYFES